MLIQKIYLQFNFPVSCNESIDTLVSYLFFNILFIVIFCWHILVELLQRCTRFFQHWSIIPYTTHNALLRYNTMNNYLKGVLRSSSKHKRSVNVYRAWILQSRPFSFILVTSIPSHPGGWTLAYHMPTTLVEDKALLETIHVLFSSNSEWIRQIGPFSKNRVVLCY